MGIVRFVFKLILFVLVLILPFVIWWNLLTECSGYSCMLPVYGSIVAAPITFIVWLIVLLRLVEKSMRKTKSKPKTLAGDIVKRASELAKTSTQS